MRILLTICGFHLQFADSIYCLRIPLIVKNSATAQFNNTHVLLFASGIHKLFWIPQIRLRIPQIRLFWSDFERYSVLGFMSVESKTAKKIKEM